jgi:TRAP-type C4-dicarboxylate transport system permease small subunit
MAKPKHIQSLFEGFCGYLLLLGVGVSLAEIVARVIFKMSFDLFFSFTVWISVWSLLLITGFLLPEGGHLSIDFIRHKFRGGRRWCLEIVIASINLGYGLFVAIGGMLYVTQLYERKAVFPNYIPIPQWQVVLCVPLGMAFFSVFALLALVRVIRKGPVQYNAASETENAD